MKLSGAPGVDLEGGHFPREMSMKHAAILTGAILLASAFAGAAQADMIKYKADMKGASEVPANTTAGTGAVEATIDTATKTLSYTINYSGLTGPAIAAHFHGPAVAGVNAPPIVPMKGDLKSPIKGDATLTDDQIAEFANGQVYFNVHTDANKGGEIRGQMTKN